MLRPKNGGIEPPRFQELEAQFQTLEPQIEDSAVKKAISILHGMIQEGWRNAGSFNTSDISVTAQEQKNAPGITLQDIAGLYRTAPKMESPAVSVLLEVGTPAPPFSLPDASGQLLGLDNFKGRRVLLVFYPLDWSPGCSQQLDLYQQEAEEFEKRGIAVVGISVDSIYSHGAWAAVRQIRFPLLADFNPKGEVAKRYQVYRADDGFTERALYLIEDGRIIYSYLSPFLHHVPDIYEMYKAIDEMESKSLI